MGYFMVAIRKLFRYLTEAGQQNSEKRELAVNYVSSKFHTDAFFLHRPNDDGLKYDVAEINTIPYSMPSSIMAFFERSFLRLYR